MKTTCKMTARSFSFDVNYNRFWSRQGYQSSYFWFDTCRCAAADPGPWLSLRVILHHCKSLEYMSGALKQTNNLSCWTHSQLYAPPPPPPPPARPFAALFKKACESISYFQTISPTAEYQFRFTTQLPSGPDPQCGIWIPHKLMSFSVWNCVNLGSLNVRFRLSQRANYALCRDRTRVSATCWCWFVRHTKSSPEIGGARNVHHRHESPESRLRAIWWWRTANHAIEESFGRKPGLKRLTLDRFLGKRVMRHILEKYRVSRRLSFLRCFIDYFPFAFLVTPKNNCLKTRFFAFSRRWSATKMFTLMTKAEFVRLPCVRSSWPRNAFPENKLDFDERVCILNTHLKRGFAATEEAKQLRRQKFDALKAELLARETATWAQIQTFDLLLADFGPAADLEYINRSEILESRRQFDRELQVELLRKILLFCVRLKTNRTTKKQH